jgi:hypothetical protein
VAVPVELPLQAILVVVPIDDEGPGLLLMVTDFETEQPFLSFTDMV